MESELPPVDRLARVHLVLATLALVGVVALRLGSALGVADGALHVADALLVLAVLLPAMLPVLSGRLLFPRLGVRKAVFERLRWAALGLHVLAVAAVTVAAALPPAEGVRGRWMLWTAYDPTLTASDSAFLAVGVALAGASAALSGLNVVATMHGARRTPWREVPFAAWGIYAQGWMHALAGPVLVAAAGSVLLERAVGLSLFNPSAGGDPILFFHLFWFGMHPLLASLVLPLLGIALEALERRGAGAGRRARWAFLVFAFVAFFGWGQHFFTAMGSFAAMVFSAWALLALAPLLYLFASAVTSLTLGPALTRGRLALVLASLLAVALFVLHALKAGTLSVAVGHGVLLYDRWGLDLLIGCAVLLLGYSWLAASREGFFALASGTSTASSSPP